jgi:hypothetical protein
VAVGNSAADVPGKNYFSCVERVVHTLKDYNNGIGRQLTISESEESVNERKQFSDTLIYLTERVARLKDTLRAVRNSHSEINSKDVGDLQMLVLTAEAWTLLGFLQVTLYSKLGLMDPVAKKKLKLQYVSEDVSIVTWADICLPYN